MASAKNDEQLPKTTNMDSSNIIDLFTKLQSDLAKAVKIVADSNTNTGLRNEYAQRQATCRGMNKSAEIVLSFLGPEIPRDTVNKAFRWRFETYVELLQTTLEARKAFKGFAPTTKEGKRTKSLFMKENTKEVLQLVDDIWNFIASGDNVQEAPIYARKVTNLMQEHGNGIQYESFVAYLARLNWVSDLL